MKKLMALIGALIVTAGALFAADPACGLWKSIDDKTGKVIVKPWQKLYANKLTIDIDYEEDDDKYG